MDSVMVKKQVPFKTIRIDYLPTVNQGFGNPQGILVGGFKPFEKY